MATLKQLIPALDSIGADHQKVLDAIDNLNALLKELDYIEVKGRRDVDVMLGCMLTIEGIIGKEEGDG